MDLKLPPVFCTGPGHNDAGEHKLLPGIDAVHCGNSGQAGADRGRDPDKCSQTRTAVN